MTPSELLKTFKLLETKFKAALQAKTGWGKNEVLELFREVADATVTELLSQLERERVYEDDSY